MKKLLLLAGAAALFATNANAQETVVVSETTVLTENVNCGNKYYCDGRDNWFIEVGAGIDMPFVEYVEDAGPKITANYMLGFGKWFTPYVGWRAEFFGGAGHFPLDKQKNGPMGHMKYVSGNIDFMWDMFNSLGGVSNTRVFSIIPFVGLGGTFAWDYEPYPISQLGTPVHKDHYKRNQWLLPVSAGLQFRFRLCKYVDFFAQARAQFCGDNFNNNVICRPVDINFTAMGGFSFNIGGRSYRSFNPCDYLDYINNLNGQINALRGALATTEAALAAANAQLPCPEVVEQAPVVVEAAPLLATVRFSINSAKISNTEKINVYNVAEWMKANEDQNVMITGYADKDTGTSDYNMQLSKKRAEAVYDMLVNEYGINANRLATDAKGSDVQPYNVNNWNRIVVFSVK